ncbi:MAG: hypothetical protein QM780_14935 [Hyphomicrobium sp.]|uniref:hypothetical protein n=1 Tax=Hyphomicrobium sp. TaxID=82 RepID=UPI0039E68C24
MARSIRIVGRLIWLGLLSVVLAVPLWAEEVTVTVPPDDTPSQAQAAGSEQSDPTAHPTDAVSSPAPAEPTPTADATPAPAAAPANAEPPSTAEATPAPPVKKHKKTKKTAATTPAGAPATETSAAAPAAGASATAATPPAKAKTKTAKASCLNLSEDKCGANTACIWVSAGTNDAGQQTKARCRSLAILKREEDKAKKTAAAKPGEPEVLPWATKGAATGSTAASTATTASVDTKPAKKKTKTASAKKPKPKPAEEAPAAAAPADSGGDSGAAAAAPAAPADAGGAD